MKSVYNTRELPHIWASGTDRQLRSPSALSVSGPIILSYGTAIGKRVVSKGRVAFLVNQTTYSNTTTKHQHMVRQAIPHGAFVIPVMYVPRGDSAMHSAAPRVIITQLLSQAADIEKRSHRRRIHDLRRADSDYAASLVLCAQSAARFFGLRMKIDAKTVERLQRQAARRVRVEQRKAEAEALRQAAEDAEKIKLWCSGDTSVVPSSLWPVHLRAIGDTVHTTMGARVSLSSAEASYRFVSSVHGRKWHHGGGSTHECGPYQLQSVDERHVVIGCHRVSWDEIERFASTQGWNNKGKEHKHEPE